MCVFPDRAYKRGKQMSKNDLLLLEAAVKHLINYLEDIGQGAHNYFYKSLLSMKYNIEICILGDFEGWERLIPILERDWIAASESFVGMSDYHSLINQLDFEAITGLRFISLVANVSQFFDKDS